ncbi:YSIRK-targeted surface antigen transcriptional regulator [Enterococcus sp. 5B3_DIV0040]|uniref:YSIRK-targeted surface antigen transcriptional regulator n=1 Tax=Enterococcus sp. 5B3_DIV0040 TaxID=1834182 RepID=UPI000A336277|nr:YSIRK-targeted surface antigen transcriptional regulator [Enterococcus sp. 5B3_DIV0040]OTO01326.1 YSIRK-targeted surface antigen transcriptional regulator [Enterococcus sp. 5B3_DIV0040]
MALSMENIQKLQSIGKRFRFSIAIYEKNGTLLSFEELDAPSLPPYPLSFTFNKKHNLSIQYGKFNEVFFIFPLQERFVSMGPMLHSQSLPKKTIENSPASLQGYLQQLPVFSSKQCRDLLVILDHLFSLQLEQYYVEYLQLLTKAQKHRIETRNHPLQKEAFTSYTALFHLEHQLMEAMAKGDPNQLYQLVRQTPLGILPIPETNDLRHEKNYCIILMEKISWFAIQMGVDIMKCLSLRDYYIQEIEKQTQVMSVLTIRDGAIVYFTELLHEISMHAYSLMIRRVIQYINVHIYDPLPLAEIEKHLFLSNTQLRRSFKQEVGISIGTYIQKQKIILAKYLLMTQIPPCTVAKELHFYDLPHFTKAFKKHTGMTPIQFQKSHPLPSNSYTIEENRGFDA